jgi:hypothetical protein
MYKTDHSAIIFTFATSLAKRGKGYWKFNSQLLRDTDYIKRVKTCITETISEYYLSGVYKSTPSTFHHSHAS